MIEAVFISDLHLHPEDKEIQARFNAFLRWAEVSVKTIYILGDFLHVWAGDDSLNDWSRSIAKQIHNLSDQGIVVYYLHGNRDFLLGSQFAKLAAWTVLTEPAFIELGEEKVLLVHGDHLCTQDKAHQRFRKLTRNRLFKTIFLRLPLAWRERLVTQVRQRSAQQKKQWKPVDVVEEAVLTCMKRHGVSTLIHGHTHLPGLNIYQDQEKLLKRYVLSDWDDSPQILCYDKTEGLRFNHLIM